MITTSEIVKNYIEEVIKGENIDLESYIKEIFKNSDRNELKQYCKDENIFWKSRDICKKDFLERIYGSCNSQLGAKILMTTDIENESHIDFYKRIYKRDYLGGIESEN